MARKRRLCPDYERLRQLAGTKPHPNAIAAAFGVSRRVVIRWLAEIGIEYQSTRRRPGEIPRYLTEAGHWRTGNLKRTKIYNTWLRMRHRCLGKSKDAVYYRDRGITICDEWRDNYDAFRSWAIKSGVRRDLTLDRIDNDGDYEPSNCRWVTQAEQCRNKRYGNAYRAISRGNGDQPRREANEPA